MVENGTERAALALWLKWRRDGGSYLSMADARRVVLGRKGNDVEELTPAELRVAAGCGISPERYQARKAERSAARAVDPDTQRAEQANVLRRLASYSTPDDRAKLEARAAELERGSGDVE